MERRALLGLGSICQTVTKCCSYGGHSRHTVPVAFGAAYHPRIAGLIIRNLLFGGAHSTPEHGKEVRDRIWCVCAIGYNS